MVGSFCCLPATLHLRKGGILNGEKEIICIKSGHRKDPWGIEETSLLRKCSRIYYVSEQSSRWNNRDGGAFHNKGSTARGYRNTVPRDSRRKSGSPRHEEYFPICICGRTPDGRYTRLSGGLVDRFDLDEVKKLCADNAQLCSFQIFPSRNEWDVAYDMEKAIECAIWGVCIPHEEFLTLRKNGLIETWN